MSLNIYDKQYDLDFDIFFFFGWKCSKNYFMWGFRYHKLQQTFSKVYIRHLVLVSKFIVGWKVRLQQGLSEPDFFNDLDYKIGEIIGNSDISDPFESLLIGMKNVI